MFTVAWQRTACLVLSASVPEVSRQHFSAVWMEQRRWFSFIQQLEVIHVDPQPVCGLAAGHSRHLEGYSARVVLPSVYPSVFYQSVARQDWNVTASPESRNESLKHIGSAQVYSQRRGRIYEVLRFALKVNCTSFSLVCCWFVHCVIPQCSAQYRNIMQYWFYLLGKMALIPDQSQTESVEPPLSVGVFQIWVLH